LSLFFGFHFILLDVLKPKGDHFQDVPLSAVFLLCWLIVCVSAGEMDDVLDRVCDIFVH